MGTVGECFEVEEYGRMIEREVEGYGRSENWRQKVAVGEDRLGDGRGAVGDYWQSLTRTFIEAP